MAEFSGKIIDAYYFDEEYTQIEVIYDDTENKKVVSYVIEVDPEHPDYKDLIAEWDEDKLAEATAEYKRQQAAAFAEAIRVSVNEVLDQSKDKLAAIEEEIEVRKKEISGTIYDSILENNEDKDTLFAFKVWALKLDAIKESSNTTKSKIRKAKSIIEGFIILNKLL